MRKAHMVGGGVKKDKLTENEYLIYTLAVLPELVFCHGFGILKNIYEGTFVEDESKIPESIKILAQGGYDNSVNINTNLPIAKNLDITSEENVDLKLPISDYKFNFDIKTSNSISFDENSVSKYLGTSLENYINSNDTEHRLNEKSFKGLINEELINNPTEYFVNIRSANVKFN